MVKIIKYMKPSSYNIVSFFCEITSLQLIFCRSLLAQSSGEIGLRSAASDQNGPTDGLWVVVLFLVFSLVVFNLWNTWADKRVKLYRQMINKNKIVENLFLGVNTEYLLPQNHVSGNKKSFTDQSHSYLRSLSLNEASLVVPHRCVPPSKLVVHLDSLPNFPMPHTDIVGEVRSCQSVVGDPNNYIVQISFDHLAEKIERPLLQYLEILSGRSTASH